MARTTLLARAAVAALFAVGMTACGSGGTEVADQVIDGGGTPASQIATPQATIDVPARDAASETATEAETPAADDSAQSQIATPGCGAPLEPGFQQLAVTSQGQTRDVTVYVPVKYDPNVATPVVLNWHGLGSSGDEQLLYSAFAPIADRETVLVAAPTGLANPDDSMKRPSWEFTTDDDPSRDDVAFANDVLDAIEAAACVDRERVYSTGMSNGGYFTSVLVCEMADRLAAAASVAGAIHDESCEPSEPVSYMEIHGTADPVVPMLGGRTSLRVDPDQRERINALMSNVIPDEVAEFAADFGCAEPTTTDINDWVTETTYGGCEDGTEVRFYAVEGAEHVWPGSGLNAMFESDTTASDSLDATEEIWAFFAAHTRTH